MITAPTLIADGAAVGEVALAFKAGKGVKAIAEAVGEACAHCLVAGTQVETPNGLVAIEDIKVGDTVLAFDEHTGEVTPAKITALIRPDPEATFAVKLVDASHHVDVFRASADHPWLLATGEWKDTSGLKAGGRVKTATGIALSVVSVIPTGMREQTYNLTVDGLHTYLIGKNHVVVHNSCVGKLGKLVANRIGTITGMTSHGAAQAAGRNVSENVMLDAVTNPVSVLEQAKGRVLYIGNEGAVVLSEAGEVVTTYPKAMYDSMIKSIIGR